MSYLSSGGKQRGGGWMDMCLFIPLKGRCEVKLRIRKLTHSQKKNVTKIPIYGHCRSLSFIAHFMFPNTTTYSHCNKFLLFHSSHLSSPSTQNL